jgi:uncharacterized protein YcbK (DUF882 family)
MPGPTPHTPSLSRRRFLACAGTAGAGLLAAPRLALASVTERRLSFLHTHTNERLSIAYASLGGYRPDALSRIDHLLRDFRTGDVHAIDPALLDLLNDLAVLAGATEPFHVISGYRSPTTNAMLRSRSGGVARHSLHMDGRAIDVRLPDVPLRLLRDAAVALGRGGVGYYPGPAFVHVDTGRVRTW